jgi:hypothetical protein
MISRNNSAATKLVQIRNLYLILTGRSTKQVQYEKQIYIEISIFEYYIAIESDDNETRSLRLERYDY